MHDRHEAAEYSELLALRSARPDPVPSAEITDQHRQALDVAMADERSSRRWRPTGRRITIAAAAVLVVAGLVATRVPADRGDGDAAVDFELAASSAFYGAPRCGTEPPPDITIPEGYDGPFDGPSPDAEQPVQPDQLVRHWTSPTGSIELRWYADSEANPSPPEARAELEPVDGVDELYLVVEGVPAGTSPMPPRLELLYGIDTESDDPCSWTQLTVFDDEHLETLRVVREIMGLCGVTPNGSPRVCRS